MLSNASKTNPLHLKLRPSRYLAFLLLLFYGGAMLLLWLLPLTLFLKIPISLLLLYDGRRQWRMKVTLSHPLALIELSWLGEGEWSLLRRDGMALQWLSLTQSVNHPWLTVLNFSTRQHLVLLPDSAQLEGLRRLRARLTLGDGSLPESK